MNAQPQRPILFVLSWALLGGGGCQLPQPQPAAAAPKREQIRINCCSLLHDLLTQQKNVDKLLLVKKESRQVHQLIKTIASASSVGAKKLERYADQDASFHLDQLSLPPGETETRSAISHTKAKELLSSAGASFELNLLLTQAEALSYAWHLSTVASANESQQERARYLGALGEEMKGLYQQTISLVRSRLTTAGLTEDSIPDSRETPMKGHTL